MNKKSLLIVIPLLVVLSLTVTPAFATGVSEKFVYAVGWGYFKNSSGVVYCGCTTLGVFYASTPLGKWYVGIYGATWLINLNSIKVENSFETLCATPAGGGAAAPIVVGWQTDAPFCITAVGCGFIFVGTVTTPPA